jgi:hypothetical protein
LATTDETVNCPVVITSTELAVRVLPRYIAQLMKSEPGILIYALMPVIVVLSGTIDI